MHLNHGPYSFLKDSSVPEFPSGNVFTVMDARCSLCARGAAWIAHNDKKQEFMIIPMQSETGIALMRHYGLDPNNPTSWLFVEDGLAYSSLDAFIRAGRRLGGVWRMFGALNILPISLRDAMYSVVARNRYRLFGTTDLCALPDADVQKRLLK